MIILCFSSGFGNSSRAGDLPLAGKDTIGYEAAIAEFREMICVAAVDVDSPLHQRALSAVESHRYTDPRFADFFRDAMTNKSSDSAATKRRRESAMRLLPFASMEKTEKTKLLLDALAGEEDEFLNWIIKNRHGGLEQYQGKYAPVSSIVSLLRNDVESLSSQLKDHLNVEQPMAIYCFLAGYSRPSPELMSLLLKATQSEQSGVRLAAIISLDSMVSNLERESSSNPVPARNCLHTLPPLDEKLASYAQKIISRYDTNKDGVLTANEWKAMLVNPATADSDQDGGVTTREYARWMMERSNR